MEASLKLTVSLCRECASRAIVCTCAKYVRVRRIVKHFVILVVCMCRVLTCGRGLLLPVVFFFYYACGAQCKPPSMRVTSRNA